MSVGLEYRLPDLGQEDRSITPEQLHLLFELADQAYLARREEILVRRGSALHLLPEKDHVVVHMRKIDPELCDQCDPRDIYEIAAQTIYARFNGLTVALAHEAVSDTI